MRIAGRAAKGTLGLLLTLGLAPAAAQNLDLDEVGAALALPIVTGPDTATEIVVTNAGSATRLHLVVLSGDAEDRWQAQNFGCEVTRNETTLFVFSSDGASGSLLTYECLDDNGDSTLFEDVPFGAATGIFFVGLEDPASGQTVNTNQIFGDAAVIDFGVGSAYSVGAIPFQGMSITEGVADRKYRFDNVEYSAFPSKLATNFLAPREDAEAAVDAELILFTLDGSTDNPPPPPARVSIKFYNDDEMVHSAGHAFDCFDIVALTQIDPRFAASALGSKAGHLVLTPQTVTYPNLAHDAAFSGAGNVLGVRRPPVHGWIVQRSELTAAPDPTVVVFNGMGTFTTPRLETGGVIVTGSADVNVDTSEGLGIVGGSDNKFVGFPESISFSFDFPSVTDVVLSRAGLRGIPTANAELEAFEPGGASLGTLTLDLIFNNPLTVSALFGDVPLESFTLTPLNNLFLGTEISVSRISFVPKGPGFDTAWGRPLAQSQTGIVPSTGDTPVFFTP